MNLRVGLRECRKVIQSNRFRAKSVSRFSMTSLSEFDLHVFKRRTRGEQEDRYTIGVWKGDVLLAICHDVCLESAALRSEMERDGGGELFVLSPNTRERSSD